MSCKKTLIVLSLSIFNGIVIFAQNYLLQGNRWTNDGEPYGNIQGEKKAKKEMEDFA
jgi:hypothetical protein